MLIVSKLFQSTGDLIERGSSDKIYDEMNLKLDGLTEYGKDLFVSMTIILYKIKCKEP